MIAGNDVPGRRLTVDVSGDGIGNSAGPIHPAFAKSVDHVRNVGEAREIARKLGITVNGLTILTKVIDLDCWYDVNVRSDTGSFVMSVRTYEDFANSILENLLREIGVGPHLTSLPEQSPPVTLNRIQSDETGQHFAPFRIRFALNPLCGMKRSPSGRQYVEQHRLAVFRLQQRYRMHCIPKPAGHQECFCLGCCAQHLAAKLQRQKVVLRRIGMFIVVERARP